MAEPQRFSPSGPEDARSGRSGPDPIGIPAGRLPKALRAIDGYANAPDLACLLAEYSLGLPAVIRAANASRSASGWSCALLDDVVPANFRKGLRAWRSTRARLFEQIGDRMAALEGALGIDSQGLHARDPSSFLGIRGDLIDRFCGYVEASRKLPHGVSFATLIRAESVLREGLRRVADGQTIHVQADLNLPAGAPRVCRARGALLISIGQLDLTLLSSVDPNAVRMALRELARLVQGALVSPRAEFAREIGTVPWVGRRWLRSALNWVRSAIR